MKQFVRLSSMEMRCRYGVAETGVTAYCRKG